MTNPQTWVAKLGTLRPWEVLELQEELRERDDDYRQHVANVIIDFFRVAYGERPELCSQELEDILVSVVQTTEVFAYDWEPFFNPNKQSGHVVEAMFFRCLTHSPSIVSLIDYYDGYITGIGQYV